MEYDPQQDSPRYKGTWIGNAFRASFPADVPVLGEIDPFEQIAGSASGLKRDRLIWEFGYTSPYAAPSPWRQKVIEIFHQFLDGGVCSGMAAATARRFDLARLNLAPRMRYADMAEITRDALYAQLQVMTNPVMLAYKPFMKWSPQEGLAALRHALAPGPTRILALLPAWGMEMFDRISESHALAVIGWEWLPNGGARIRVVDPNAPEGANTVFVSAQGEFHYSAAGLTYTSAPGAPQEYNYFGFRLAAIPATAYFPQQRQPFFDVPSVGFG